MQGSHTEICTLKFFMLIEEYFNFIVIKDYDFQHLTIPISTTISTLSNGLIELMAPSNSKIDFFTNELSLLVINSSRYGIDLLNCEYFLIEGKAPPRKQF